MSEGIVKGIRGEEFKNFIKSILKKGKMKKSVLESIVDDKGMDLYAQAFTNPTYDNSVNYEFFEKLGDATCNKTIVSYIYKKYPKLGTKPEGVMILTRMSHILRSSQIFSQIALKLGFEPFISVGLMYTVKGEMEPVMKIKRNSVLEDCFEAFFGTTEILLDSLYRQGVGYAICSTIITSILDDIELPSIKYEDLFDSITRLKELFDYSKFPLSNGKVGRIGKYEYIDEPETLISSGSSMKNIAIKYTDWNNNISIIAKGHGSIKDKAKIDASEKALEYFKKIGFYKAPRYNYLDFL